MAAGPYVESQPPRHLVEHLKERQPDAVREENEFRGEITLLIPRERIVEVCRFLKDDPEADFAQLTCVIGTHFLERDYDYEVIYELLSLEKNHRLRLKVRLKEGETAGPAGVSLDWDAALSRSRGDWITHGGPEER